jgi:hypothetical protein
MYAVHIHTQSPTSAIQEKVPLHAWTGHKPDASHLRVFGCIAYVNIPKRLWGGRLEVTATKCCMLSWWADEDTLADTITQGPFLRK